MHAKNTTHKLQKTTSAQEIVVSKGSAYKCAKKSVEQKAFSFAN